jgi:UV excision repair protein RAD23
LPNLTKANSAEERLVMGAEYEKTVAELVGMGFSKEEVTRALKAAFNNPERATEYLVSVRLPPHFF